MSVFFTVSNFVNERDKRLQATMPRGASTGASVILGQVTTAGILQGAVSKNVTVTGANVALSGFTSSQTLTNAAVINNVTAGSTLLIMNYGDCYLYTAGSVVDNTKVNRLIIGVITDGNISDSKSVGSSATLRAPYFTTIIVPNAASGTHTVSTFVAYDNQDGYSISRGEIKITTVIYEIKV